MIFRKIKKTVNSFIHRIRLHAATKCEYMEEIKNAKCCHCGKRHDWNVYEDSMYRGKTLCSTCYEEHFGHCNSCGELYLYTDMNDNNICSGCEILQHLEYWPIISKLDTEKRREFIEWCKEAGFEVEKDE